ncbi:MAG: endonuclease/exonuclease/phosphatase family protein, partial [Bdellovibrionota bacterium]
MKFTLVTWNIHKCIGGVDRSYRPSRVIETLLHYKPDIVFLQEVDEGAKRSQFHRQVDVLGDALGMRHRCYGPNHRMREGHYGNAILSRWPLFDVTNMDLTIGNRKDRGVLHARARVYLKGHLRTLVLYNLHLGLSGKERGLQLERYLRSHPFRGLHHQTPV